MSKMTWREAWLESGCPEWIVDQFEHIHGIPPAWLTQLVVEDDKKCGIGPLTLGSDPSCRDHDILMLLHKYEFPIEPIPATQGRFLAHSIAIGILAAGTAVIALPKGIVGATVGGIMQIVREVF